MELLEKLGLYLTYPFVQYAVIVSVLIALCSALLGVTLVLKRLSFIGDGLSHVAFGAMAFATVLGFMDQMLLILPVTILVAILLLCTGKNSKIRGDAAIAMLSVGALAVGYLALNVFPESAQSGNIAGDVCGTLFGSTSILTLSKTDVWLCIALSVVVLLAYILCYRRIFAVTFDENFAAATGIQVKLYNLLIALITAIVIVLAMNLVGSLLISALIVFPTLSAMRIFKNFKSVVIASAVISVFCAVTGIFLSILFSTPVGATIVAMDIVLFAVFALIGFIKKG